MDKDASVNVNQSIKIMAAIGVAFITDMSGDIIECANGSRWLTVARIIPQIIPSKRPMITRIRDVKM
jgi:hypothetical protein